MVRRKYFKATSTVHKTGVACTFILAKQVSDGKIIVAIVVMLNK